MTPAIEMLPEDIRHLYQIIDKRHAIAILQSEFPVEFADLIDVLRAFRLRRSSIVAPGGQKSPVAREIDHLFEAKGWHEKMFRRKVILDGRELDASTHRIDNFRNRIAIEVEWNNKDPFYDRDLNNFRLLHELQEISVGVMITRSDELQDIFNELGKGASYGGSTTHMRKLEQKIDGGGAGGCPLLVFGMTKKLYMPDQ